MLVGVSWPVIAGGSRDSVRRNKKHQWQNIRGVSETRKGMPTNIENEIKGEKNPPLDEDDMAFLCIKESDTCLAAPDQWDLVSDKQVMQEQPLQVTKMHKDN